MQALDGNAIAGPLLEFFGADMTSATGTCAHCGTPSRIAELEVFLTTMGGVVRCRNCGQVVIVLVEIRGTTHVHLVGFRLDEPR
jgi:uncharacterized Zn finger protein